MAGTENVKKTKIVCRNLMEPGEPVRTYIYSDDGSFEIEEEHVRGIIVYATDNLLAPDVEKGMRLLVNTDIRCYDGDDLYVFDKQSGNVKDIAKLVKNADGTFDYISDESKPEKLLSLDHLHFIGKVHEVQVRIPCCSMKDLNKPNMMINRKDLPYDL